MALKEHTQEIFRNPRKHKKKTFGPMDIFVEEKLGRRHVVCFA